MFGKRPSLYSGVATSRDKGHPCPFMARRIGPALQDHITEVEVWREGVGGLQVQADRGLPLLDAINLMNLGARGWSAERS